MSIPREMYPECFSFEFTEEIDTDNHLKFSNHNINNSEINVEDSSTLKSKGDDKAIGQKETRDVTRLKLVVISILVASSIAVGLTTYYYIKDSEKSKFHENFNDDAFKVMQTVGASVENTFAALDLLSTTMVSHAISSNESWPFVTIPHFGNKVSKIITMSAGLSLCTTVVVEADQREEWEKYSWANRGIVNESLQILSTDVNYRGQIGWDVPLNPSIHSDYGPVYYNESYVRHSLFYIVSLLWFCML
jgi:hypothetical protein